MQARATLAALETKHGGRLGVVAVDTASGRRIAYRPREYFAMCSTHKFLSTAAVLSQVDRGRLSLDGQVPYSRADLLSYAPITKQHVGAGFMTVDALCAAAIEWSDSTAANLLLKLIDGPDGWTRYARSLGDTVSRLDRTEPRLNSAIPGDVRDATTPGAMNHDLDAVLLGTALSEASRARLEGWMRAGRITGSLLRAGLPKDWLVGDKSGSGDNGTRNDIGIIRPPRRAPILAAVYYTESTEPPDSRDRVIAEAARTIALAFAA
jgi:beta-lactamase class A